MGLGDSFVVNNFMFCTDHGREYCNSCFCDYREGNNYQVELDDATTEKLEELFLNIDNRPALNAYALGAKLANRKKETYKCTKHGTVDCCDCFDWVKLILKSAEVFEGLSATMGSAGSSQRMVTVGQSSAAGKRVDVDDVD